MPSLGEYAARWLATVRPPLVKWRTAENYERVIRLHVLPSALAPLPLDGVTRRALRAFAQDRLDAGYSLGTVRLIVGTVRAMLSAAVEDEYISGNPAFGIGRTIARRLRKTRDIRAMDRAQLAHFLGVALARAPHIEPLFLLLARTGCRLGEALGLQWSDLDLTARRATIARTWYCGVLDTPKDHHARVIELADDLVARLRTMQARDGHSPWVFPGGDGEPLDASGVAQMMKRLLKHAHLPRHFSPKDFRHSFASQLLSEGVTPAWVQQQLGHASIQLTVDTYGKWLRIARPDALDRLKHHANLGPPAPLHDDARRVDRGRRG